MNTFNVLKNGHDALLSAIRKLTETDLHTSRMNEQKPIKDIMAQVVPFERALLDILNSFLDNHPTPTLDALRAGYDVFMEQAVAPYQEQAIHELWAEYEVVHAQTVVLLAQIPPKVRHQKGTLPWYGMEFSLEDFIIYTFFGTKRKWSVQISIFRNQRSQTTISSTA